MDIENTWEGIVTHAEKSGAKFPELVAAQWALESARGTKVSGKNNFFGLKNVSQQAGTSVSTQEFYDGKWVTINAGFIDFPTIKASVEYLVSKWYKDYKTFKGVNNAADRNAAAHMLKEEGYATDPAYPLKLIKLMDQHAPKNKKQMIGPQKRPHDFGFTKGDTHLVVNDLVETMKAFTYEGKLLWEIPCLARGQYSDFEWKIKNSDTPPGLYRIGTIYKDYEKVGAKPAYDRTLLSYGWYSFDLVELENQEQKYGRAGIMIHGGGSACGWPGAWDPNQSLYPTYGCIRCKNINLRDKILPLTKQGKVFVSVWQEG